MKKIFIIIAVAMVLCAIVGCNTTKEKEFVYVTAIEPSQVTVARGSTQGFYAITSNDQYIDTDWWIEGNNSTLTEFIAGRLSVSFAETSSTIIVYSSPRWNYEYFATSTVNVIVPDGFIEFGGLLWRVLDIQNNRTLIISAEVIEKRAYHNTYSAEITWEHCDLRVYLNTIWYNSFNVADRALIVEVTNTNENNQWYGNNGGNLTQDKIFLLSLAEVVQYFGDSGYLMYRPSDNPSVINDQYNSNRMATYNWQYLNEYNSRSIWWLRSPGGNNYGASIIDYEGQIDLFGTHIDASHGGVRPALWLNL